MADGPVLRAAAGSVLYLVLIGLLSLGAAAVVRPGLDSEFFQLEKQLAARGVPDSGILRAVTTTSSSADVVSACVYPACNATQTQAT